jgi:peptide/nickel transport system substrate-binding protein
MIVTLRFVRHHLALLIVTLLAMGLAWGLCVSLAAASSPSPATGKVVLRIGWTTDPDNLNPFIGYANWTFEIWSLNYQTLFGLGVDGKPTLDAAAQNPTQANGGISADGKVWTVHIKPNLRWQDGTPLTADDVAWTYNYAIKNHMANVSVQTIGIRDVKALNATTVQIVCSKPKADMESSSLYILPEHIWQNVSPQAAQRSYLNSPPVIGSGPFETVKWVKGNYLEMVRNPYYSGPKPTIDTILFEDYQNADTMAKDLQSGAIDAAYGILPAQYRSLQSLKGIQAIGFNNYNWDYLDCNCYTGSSGGNPVLRDWRFRHALAYAIDQQKLIKIAENGNGLPGTTIVSPNTWSNPDYHWQPSVTDAYTFDLAKANQLLDQAGYPRGPDGLRLYKGKPIELRLWAKADTDYEQTEGKLLAGWFKQLGLKIDFSVIDYGAMAARVWNFDGSTYDPQFDLYVSDWIGYTDPGPTLTAFTTSMIGSINETGWSNAQYDKLAVQQETTLDLQTRKDRIWQMQQIMYQQAPWIVLTYPYLLEAYNTDRWTGWTRALNGHGPAVVCCSGAIASYLNLRPRSASVGGTSNRGWIAAIIVAVAVVVGVLIWRIRRRPTDAVERE